ncbi:alpha-2-macroglobulin-like [Candidatus Vecturithrix granuli]|uniref:Alpha-2-macroglobulin-like n=1 Tax=Vecturithrix granuli TaxID=1499967 RepID=A0A081BXN6_VECG1|nr:alpha-2-macroglobulin-like [Candidatus Vecturithrix granuli]
MVYQQQRKFDDALRVWAEFLQKYPADQHWNEVQRLMIDTEYLMADKLLCEEAYQEARTAWEHFLSAYPLDQRNPEIMFRIGETFVKEAEKPTPDPSQTDSGLAGKKEELYQQAILQWQRTASKYPGTEPASQAQYEIGRLFETRLLKFEEAFDAYKKITWGSYMVQAQERLRLMQSKRLTVLTERAFRANETPALKVTTRNIESLTFKMYKIDLETYFRKMQTTDGVDDLDIALIDPDQSWQETIHNYERFREFEQDLAMPFKEPGAYLVTCSEENVKSGDTGYEATTLVLITDLDVIVKSTKQDVLVFAQNMRTGEVYPDIKLLLSDGAKIFTEQITGKDGVFHAAFEELKDLQDLRVFAYDGKHYASNTLNLSELQYIVGLQSRGYLYTDRPAYRPGQQVNIKGIVRENDAQGVLRIPKPIPSQEGHTGLKYQLSVLSSQGTPVYQAEIELSEFGSFAVDFDLSAAAPLGAYRIVLNRGRESYSGQFLVEEYKLEQVKLSIETEREVYFRGETITGTITAQYYYGEPLKDKPVTYTLVNLETRSEMTNQQGKIEFSFSTRDFAESQPITLTARLDDEHVQIAKTVWLATRGFDCTVNTLRNVYLVNEDIEVKVAAADPAGNAVQETFTLGVFKRETTPYNETAEVKVVEQQVTTGEEGSAKTSIRLPDGGTYILRAEGRDRFDNPVSGQTEVFISGKDDEIMLRLIADREEFNVGEQPEVTLFSRAKAGLGLLTYEGEAILSYQIIMIQPEKNPLSLAISSELAPNFTLAVTQMEDNTLHQAQKEFAVIQGLNIAIDVQKPGFSEKPGFFEPSETIEVHIITTDQNGNPVAAEVSLAMVDEALYAQYADQIPPIRDFFYDQQRELAASTASSCTFRFEAETREMVTDLIEEEQRYLEELAAEPEAARLSLSMADEVAAPSSRAMAGMISPMMDSELKAGFAPPAPPAPMEKDQGEEFLSALREYFPETGYWNPNIVTGADGKAVVTVELPDSTTEWRFTSRGITRDTLVGENTAGIITKLPFFADLKVPAIFTEGDNVSVLANLHNASGKAQDAQLAFRASMQEIVLEQQTQQIQVQDQSMFETAYRLDLSRLTQQETIAPLTLELTANADQLQDRIKRETPMRLWGIEYISTKSGTLQDDRSIEISLPGDRQYLFREMQILLNPAIDRTLLDLTDDAPWPLRAPRSSSIHEAQMVLNALQSVGPDFAQVNIRELQERLQALLTDISLQQNQDGGWNWTGTENRSDLFVSADAIVLLAQARKQGHGVRTDVWQNGLNYLKREFQAVQDNELKTYLLHALTIAEDVDFAHINRVYRERNTLRTPGLALLTLMYHELNRPEIARELLTALQNKATIQQDQATGMQMAFWPSDSPYPWLQDPVETTALALLAVQKVEPGSRLIPAAVDWLYSQRCWIGWGSMRTNARVSTALREYLSHARYASSRYRLEVKVNGEMIDTLTVDNEQGASVLHIAPHLLKDTDNTVTFDFEGRGTLNYVCVLKGVSRDVRKTQEHFEIWRYYEPAPLMYKGQEIPRGFSVLDGSYSTWRNELTQIPLGGYGRVTLQFQRREFDTEHPYINVRLILEEPLPSGCTVLSQSIQGQLLDYEIADGKILFYLNNARYGTVSYDLYGYLPGEYRVLPSQIRDPYFPERRDYGEPYQITVLKRGEAITEQYKKTPDELYYSGKALFDDKRHAEAQPLLQQLFEQYRLHSDYYRDTARMLLYIAIAQDNSRDIVQYFEILKEKYPDLVLSFEDIIRVGQAYRDIQEYERAIQVFKATAEASFLKDVQVSGTLEAQGEFLSSIEYTRNLIAEYPDIPVTETSFYALAQLLSTEAERLRQNPGVSRNTPYSRKELLERTIDMFQQFLARYPENPIVDEVSFSLLNAYLDLEAFETVVQAAQRSQQRYLKSPYFSGYQYIEGYADFELERYEESLKLCRTVATGKYLDSQGKLVDSDHKNLALYIMGQIYHSMRRPEQAIAEYEKVKDQFPDAREAIAYFTRKLMKLEEASTFRPGEEAQITLHHRNVKDVNLLVYRVDLMTLYLLQKNLNNITNINLAGITPYHQEHLILGDGKDYAEKTYKVALPLQKEGAYLVVAKESELDSSGMVLLSQLKLEVEEDPVSGRVRVNVLNAESGKYENKVHVKVIGSGDSEFVSGSTDLRGIFIADNIHGAATVIARKGDQYAFYRGKAVLQAPDVTVQRPPLEAPADMRSQAMQQLRETNIAIQQQSGDYLRQNLYQNTLKGVEVQSTY